MYLNRISKQHLWSIILISFGQVYLLEARYWYIMPLASAELEIMWNCSIHELKSVTIRGFPLIIVSQWSTAPSSTTKLKFSNSFASPFQLNFFAIFWKFSSTQNRLLIPPVLLNFGQDIFSWVRSCYCPRSSWWSLYSSAQTYTWLYKGQLQYCFLAIPSWFVSFYFRFFLNTSPWY